MRWSTSKEGKRNVDLHTKVLVFWNIQIAKTSASTKTNLTHLVYLTHTGLILVTLNENEALVSVISLLYLQAWISPFNQRTHI